MSLDFAESDGSTSLVDMYRHGKLSLEKWSIDFMSEMDTLGIEPRASRMLSGCDTTTPCAL